MAINPEIIGSLAGILTTSAYVPQVIKVLRERHTSSLSLIMYSIITVGVALWFFYGILIGSLSVILANGIGFILALIILIMKIKHG